ncbi:SDR family NAD(P)-dependent oxidoreductase [Nocardia sp. NBC_00565]|uniref:SDR family NAD(P)-dependent oxidoreductase n=1 Tax=Nocardia sp. NBC_00565 TaxID=2975993 RepID=UPI002E807FA9|nr:SDR family NAD(P)-dependent oxidoreductase [Nocardia sp. NBC_00565]WUC06811.1 SDR family NAD(P)-dependent oxidoreductase [Nocardia sp. NBC_00565]
MAVGVPDLTGRSAVVTGGAAGIGYAIAASLIARGAAVTIADVQVNALEAAAAELGVPGIVADVSRIEDVRRLADDVLARHGRIDIAINNAGVAKIAPFADLTLADFRWVIDVNLWGVINGMNVFLPIIESTSSQGFIVNTASIAGLRTGSGLAAYGVSKFGVVALTETVSDELARRNSQVGVGVLVPAMVRSDIADSERNRPGVQPVRTTRRQPSGIMAAEVVGEIVADAVERGDLYIVTHPDSLESLRARHRRIEDAFAAAARRHVDAGGSH